MNGDSHTEVAENQTTDIQAETKPKGVPIFSRELSSGRSLALGKQTEEILRRGGDSNELGVTGLITPDEVIYWSPGALGHYQILAQLENQATIGRVSSRVDHRHSTVSFTLCVKDLEIAKKMGEFLKASLRGSIQDRILLNIYVSDNPNNYLDINEGGNFLRAYPVTEGEGTLRQLNINRLGSQYKKFNEP